MSNQDEEVETRGSPYVPSARKSIHNHPGCNFLCCTNMGRYGVNTRHEQTTTSSTPQYDQGTDEVDNVMSKFTRQTSPVPVRHAKAKRKERRGSFNISDPEYSDDEELESNMLAKSLPANLPSYYCSNNIAHRSLPSDLMKAHNSSSFSEITNKHINRSNEYYHHEYSTTGSFENYIDKNQKTKGNGKCFQQVIFTLTVAIVSVAAAFYYRDWLSFTQTKIKNYDEFEFNKDMNYLGAKYKINDNSILEVQSGISTISERNDTGSFIFVYNGESVNFNYLQFSNFIQDIASTAARYLRNESVVNKPTVLQSSELNMQSHSEFMVKYRHEVDKTGVMLVQDVDKIPSSLAMAFHYFCDEYNPLVAKSAIFFTLNTANCSNFQGQRSTHSHVEKCLAEIWHTLPKDNIKPLLARVVNVIIDVTDVN